MTLLVLQLSSLNWQPDVMNNSLWYIHSYSSYKTVSCTPHALLILLLQYYYPFIPLPWYFFYYCQLINTISIIPLLWCYKRELLSYLGVFLPPLHLAEVKVRCWSHCNKSEVARLNTPQWRIIPMISGWKSIMWWAGRWRPDILSTLWHGKWNQLMEKPFEV